MRLRTVHLVSAQDGRALFRADGENSHMPLVQVGDQLKFEKPVPGTFVVRQRLFKLEKQDNGVWVADLHLLVEEKF